jgi:aerobic-type carbon monoxide dehydrogenase small subunit (CoxS/CutS family)
MERMRVTVNDETYEQEVDPRLLLVHLLRDELDLTGTNVGCETTSCGACTVLVDGAPRRSCMLPVTAAAGRRITTIEGLAGRSLHAVQRAWIEEDVSQCGYCQAGQLMSAAALLARRPDPSDADIDAAMNGNICRCGTYLRIRQAIHRAADLSSNTTPAGQSGRR